MEEPVNELIPLPVPETTNKYSKCKIYYLSCLGEYYYIGATTTELRFRLNHHKADSKKYPDRRVYKYINEIGWENVKIECIEEFSCASRQEMLEKETEYLNALLSDDLCLNNNVSLRTEEEQKEYIKQYYTNNIGKIKEYRQTHRDRILEYKKKYREEKSEKITEYNKKYIQENQEQIKERKKKYNNENKEKISKKAKEYNELHKDEIAAYKKKWAEEHKDELDKKGKEYRESNKEILKEKSKQYYEENKEACQKRMKEYREKNLEKCKELEKKYREKKKKENPEVSIPCDICGGSYLPHHKNRHNSSKKHQNKLIDK